MCGFHEIKIKICFGIKTFVNFASLSLEFFPSSLWCFFFSRKAATSSYSQVFFFICMSFYKSWKSSINRYRRRETNIDIFLCKKKMKRKNTLNVKIIIIRFRFSSYFACLCFYMSECCTLCVVCASVIVYCFWNSAYLRLKTTGAEWEK